MEKVSKTLFSMLRDRNIEIECTHFNDLITVVNKDLIVIKVEENKVGINTVKSIASSLEDYNANHAIVLYNNSITAFAKNSIVTLLETKKVEFFMYEELMYNVTEHCLVPKHILISPKEKKTVLKTYNVSEKKIPYILSTDPVSRYYNAQPGQMFKIIRNSEVTCKSISYRVVV